MQTKITALCDDHVFWPPEFLPHVLAPFEDRNVGAVDTCKRGRRVRQKFSSADFWNFIGVLHLERRNFDSAATSTVDGGVSCISGRTSVHRTQILTALDFVHEFLHEYCFFGLIGPLHGDDDKFITRWMINHGWKTVTQQTPGARIETTLGEYPKFLFQCLRWARTTWRGNFTNLIIDRTVWRTQPWCVYAVYLNSFVNLALFYDSSLLFTGWLAFNQSSEIPIQAGTAMIALVAWMLSSKLVKPLPHFLRNPNDIVYLPGYILFGYFHSLIKLYALFTINVTAWGSRPGVDPPRLIKQSSGGIHEFFIKSPMLMKSLKFMGQTGAFALLVCFLRGILFTGIDHMDQILPS